jgi:hypothetical protein
VTDDGGSSTHHFADSRRVLQRVPNINERPPLFVLLLLDDSELRVQVVDVVSKVLDGLETFAEIPAERNLNCISIEQKTLQRRNA